MRRGLLALLALSVSVASVGSAAPAPADPGWRVLVQSLTDSLELIAAAVVVATGGYVEPLEHRSIAGPRPAGIMTADLAWRVLDAGLLPGRVVALVGADGVAADLTRALVDAGTRVERLAAVPDEVRGEARLEAVRVGPRWIVADTLVLADRLVAQAILLRGLGLVDGRPGMPAPVDDEGRLPLEGLWAVGCCVEPDLAHRACAEQGRRIGRRIAASLGQRTAARA